MANALSSQLVNQGSCRTRRVSTEATRLQSEAEWSVESTKRESQQPAARLTSERYVSDQ